MKGSGGAQHDPFREIVHDLAVEVRWLEAEFVAGRLPVMRLGILTSRLVIGLHDRLPHGR
jgi:hypothetical protein